MTRFIYCNTKFLTVDVMPEAYLTSGSSMPTVCFKLNLEGTVFPRFRTRCISEHNQTCKYLDKRGNVD